jgi:HlyD family secretion protein
MPRAHAACGTLSEQRILQLLTEEQTAHAQLQASLATAELAALRLRQTRVIAPDEGLISARSAAVGSVISSTQELFRLIRQARLEWRAEVTSHDLVRLQVGTVARLQAPNGEPVNGTVRVIAPSVEPQTRVGLIYVDLPATTALKAGMFARASSTSMLHRCSLCHAGTGAARWLQLRLQSRS